MCSLQEGNKVSRGKLRAIIIHNLAGVSFMAEYQSQIGGNNIHGNM